MPSPEKKTGVWTKTKEALGNITKSNEFKLFAVGVLGLAVGAWAVS